MREPSATQTTGAGTNTSNNRINEHRPATVEDADDDEERTRVPSDPVTSPRGGSQQGTPARGRARVASPDSRQANNARAGRRGTTRPQAHPRTTNANANRAEERPGRTSTNPALRARNLLITNLFLAETVHVSKSGSGVRVRADAAQAASHARYSTPPAPDNPSSSTEDEEVDNAAFPACFTRQNSVSTTNTDIEGDSEPEVVSDVFITASPRRPKATVEQELGAESIRTAQRFQSPLSRPDSGSATAAGSKSKHGSKAPSKPTTRQHAQKGAGLSINTGFQRMKLSSSPPTGETQHEDGDGLFSWQRTEEQLRRARLSIIVGTSGIPLPDSDFSVSAAFRSHRAGSHSSASSPSARDSDIDDDIIPTRPNTPPPPVKSKALTQRSHRPKTICIRICDNCERPLPSPPLPSPTSRSNKGSSSSTCEKCYQPLHRVTQEARSTRSESKIANKRPEVDQASSPVANSSSSTRLRVRKGSSPVKGNALGLINGIETCTAGAGPSVLGGQTGPSRLRHARAEDPRSPCKRSDTLSEM